MCIGYDCDTSTMNTCLELNNNNYYIIDVILSRLTRFLRPVVTKVDKHPGIGKTAKNIWK